MRFLVLVLTVLLLVPPSSYAQEPYVLSKEVQELALQPNLQARLNNAFQFRFVSQDPGILRYLDALTAVDVIAAQRNKQSERKDANRDHMVAFAVLCFWPNKPPPSPGVAEMTKEIHARLIGSYVLPAKRGELMSAVRPMLLKDSFEEITKFMSARGTGTQEYLDQILDVRKLKK